MSTRRVRRFADRFAVHVGLVRHTGNGTPVMAGTSRGLSIVLLALATGACSLSFPMASLKPDHLATGSVDRSAAMLSPALDGEDWRRARAALAVTLDPQGNGGRANWRNPQSGAHGAFTAVGPPFPDQDRVCRKFVGEVAAAAAADTRVAGSACRDGAGDWALRDQVAPSAS